MLQPINNAPTLSGPGFQDLNARFQDLGFRPSTRGFRTWISGPGFQALGIWLSGPGFQDLESSPSYGRLIFFPSLFCASTVTFLFPVTFLCVHRHFSLRPVVTDRLTAHRQTDQRALVEIIQRPSVRAGSPVENLSVRPSVRLSGPVPPAD